MKDITDYFSSPTKARNSLETTENAKPAEETADQNVNTENKIENSTNKRTLRNDESKQSKRKRRRKPTDPEVKGMTELLSNNLSLVSPNSNVVETISDLSPIKNNDTKLKDVSIDNSGSSTAKKKKVSRSPRNEISKSAKKDKPVINNKTNKTPSKSILNSPKENILQDIDQKKPSNNDIVEIDDNESNSEPPKTNPKVNAFQFMMNSRNNILGQNSNGKTVKEENTSISEEKQKLSTRKNLFKNWADQKGGLKRKREEEEVEKCIKIKMEQRAQRLKKLIKGKKGNESKEEKERKPLIKGKKTIKKISSSESESSSDVISVETNKGDTISSPSLVEISEVIEENAQDIVINPVLTVSPPSKKHKENGKNNLLNFFGVVSRKENDEKIEVFDDSPDISKESSKELIKIKMFTPASTKKRTSLLSLNKNHSKSMTDESSQDSIKVKKHKKKKKKSKDVEADTHKEIQLNDSLEDFCSPCKEEEANKSTKNVTKNEAVNTFLVEGSADVVVEESTEDSDVLKPKRKNNTKQYVIVDDSEESRSSEGGILKPSPDLDDVKSEVLKVHDIIVLDGDFEAQSLTGDQILTPANLKTRKKGNIRDKRNSKEPLRVEIESKPSESHGRVLRPKKNNLNYSDSCNNSSPKTPKSIKKEKNMKNQNKKESVEEVCLSSGSESEPENSKKAKAPVKVAPVFLKATPKPKPDPEVIEARKQFLLSGVPDSLKITIEKQKSMEEKEHNIFPVISHIQQKCGSKLWDLPRAEFKFSEIVPFEMENKSLVFNSLIVRQMPYDLHITSDKEKINNINGLLDKIKTENPNYPVYKVFRHIYEKSGKNYLQDQVKSKTPKRRSKKSSKKSIVPENVSKGDSVLKDSEMWSEKYKPQCSEEILGNHNGVTALKNWLETWMNYSEEINARGKRKRANSNSESEFESTDCDSRDSTRLPGNTMILGGPCGSGKTSAVYAIANELGFNVLELNGSTKRTGKRLLQELQEATQSHQVRKKHNGLVNFMNTSKDSNKDLQKADMKLKKMESEDKSEKDKKKMCILLVEDIDLVFDQDEGFLTSLTQLIATSKRPIILTTTDNSPAHIQKLISQYECISFMPLSLQCLGVWLQILCLVEGLLVDKDDLGNLLEYNKGDIRKTLLELQFWSQSGGQLERDRVYPLSVQGSVSEISCNLKTTDEELKLALKGDDQGGNMFVHRHCLGSFETFRENELYNVPPKVDLGMLWWNMPNIMEIPSCASERLNRQKGSLGDNQAEISVDITGKDQQKLASLMNLYDAITLTDSFFNSVDHYKSHEPVVKNWMTEVRATLNLTERDDDKTMYLDLVHDVTHIMVNGCINMYKKIDETSCRLNMALPDINERRWRAKQHICEDFLKEPISLSNSLDRSSVALDYLPVLRHIARFEDKRAAANTKRGNRFRHYLKNLNMSFKESACKLACNVLSVTLDE